MLSHFREFRQQKRITRHNHDNNFKMQEEQEEINYFIAVLVNLYCDISKNTQRCELQSD